MFSERVSVHLTGRSRRWASDAAITYSQYAPCLAPKPPPTAGATTRTSAGSRPSAPARGSRTPNGPCVGTVTVSSPRGSRLDEHAVRLHRYGRHALVDEATLHDEVGVVEDRRILTELERDGEVRTVLGEHHGRTLGERRLGVDHDGERVVVDDHCFGRINRLRASVRGDDRDDVADEAHDALGERRAIECGREHDEALDGGEAQRVVRRDEQHAGHALRLTGVDRHEPCVRHRRPHERDVDGVRWREIVDIAGRAAEQPSDLPRAGRRCRGSNSRETWAGMVGGASPPDEARYARGRAEATGEERGDG